MTIFLKKYIILFYKVLNFALVHKFKVMCCIWKYQQIMVTFILTLNKDDEKSRKRRVRKDEMSKRC